MTEQDIQADYTRKVEAARAGLKKALDTRILNLKAERNRALELIRKETEINAEAQERQKAEMATPYPAIIRDEEGSGLSEEGTEPESGLDQGVGDDQGEGPQEAPPPEPQDQE